MSEYFVPLVSSTSDPDHLRTGPLTTGVQFHKWDLGKPFHLTVYSESSRDFQVQPSFFPSISLNGPTGGHFMNDLAGTEGERIELTDQNLDKATGLLSGNEYVWIQKLQDSQPCRTGTMFSIDDLKNEEYLSNLLKASRGSLNDLEVEHETIYRARSSEPAKFFEQKTETKDKMQVHPHPFRESDGQERKRRRNYEGIENHNVDSGPNLVHEREKHILNAERIFRPRGGKDRHSKVRTSKGLRDRRVRLSVSTAIQFYDIQDRLDYDHPSKAIDWLMAHAKVAIDELRGSGINPPARSSVPEPKSSLGFKSSIDEEIATYCATSQISDSSRSGSVRIGTLDVYEEPPESQVLASLGFSITSRTSEVFRNSLLRAKDHQASPNLLRGNEKQFWGTQANNKIPTSSSNSDGSRDHDVATTALGSSWSESRDIDRRSARERPS